MNGHRAISILASSPFWPVLFLILARVFWNQILIWFSFRSSSRARFFLRSSVRYRLSSNSRFNRPSCSDEKAVLGRLSLFDLSGGGRSDFLTRRVRGPENIYRIYHFLVSTNHSDSMWPKQIETIE